MAIHIMTGNAGALLAAFRKAIDDKRVVTWSYDAENDFTHTPEQWKNLAWLRPEVQSDRLVFTIVKPQNSKVSSEVYAIYHGRLIESMLAHLDQSFTNAYATALPNGKDLVQ